MTKGNGRLKKATKDVETARSLHSLDYRDNDGTFILPSGDPGSKALPGQALPEGKLPLLRKILKFQHSKPDAGSSLSCL